MYEPVRGGTRGGQAEFKWSDVSADKDREHYLGHSINAPTGRWQKNKDVHWYNRDAKSTEEEKQAELRKIKEVEEEAMAQLLGFAPSKKVGEGSPPNGETGKGQDDNGVAHDSTASKEEELQRKMEKRLRKQERQERKAEKKARKEAKRLHTERRRSISASGHRRNHGDERRDGASVSDNSADERVRERHHRPNSRSRSPRRRPSPERDSHHMRRRSASPSRTQRRPRSPSPPVARRSVHEKAAMEHERVYNRRRWDDNTRREQPHYSR